MKDNSAYVNELIENVERITGKMELQTGNLDLDLLSSLLEERSISINELSKEGIGRDRMIELLGSLRSRDAVVKARLKVRKSEFSEKIENNRKSDEIRNKYSRA